MNVGKDILSGMLKKMEKICLIGSQNFGKYDLFISFNLTLSDYNVF